MEGAATSTEIPTPEQAGGVPDFGDAFALARIATGVVLACVLPLWAAALLPLVGLDAAVHPFWIAGAVLVIPGVMVAVGVGRRIAAAVALLCFVSGAGLLVWSEPMFVWGPAPGTWVWAAVSVLLLWAPPRITRIVHDPMRLRNITPR